MLSLTPCLPLPTSSATLYNLPRLIQLDDKPVSPSEVATAKSEVLHHAIRPEEGAKRPPPPPVTETDTILARLATAMADLEGRAPGVGRAVPPDPSPLPHPVQGEGAAAPPCPTCGAGASSAFMSTLALLRESHKALLHTNAALLEQLSQQRAAHEREVALLRALIPPGHPAL